MMPSSDVAIPKEGSLVAPRAIIDKAARFQAFTAALQGVNDPRCARPIPRFMVGMPWADDDEDVSERIIAAMLAADDPYQAQDAGKTVSGKDLVGRRVTVHDMRVRPSDKAGGWGAYLLLDCTVDDDDTDHRVVTIGAKQAVATLAYAWYSGDLPVVGTVTVITETAGGNTVLGFIVERDL